MTHLVVDISGHGFGHAGQVLPLVRALIDDVRGLRVTLRSQLPPEKLREHLGRPFSVASPSPDIGMLMHGPMEIDAAASVAAYAGLHRDWAGVVAGEAARLGALTPDLLLADVPYSSLAAARRAGIPAVALSSLNWGQILEAYCGDRSGMAEIVSQIRDAYAGAESFLQIRPHAPMPDLPNARPIGPICRQGRDRGRELRASLGQPERTRLGLLAFGGIAGRLDVGPLPARAGLVWLRSGATGARDDVVDADAFGIPFCDLAASADVVLTKAGYGTVCETLAVGTRLIFVDRPGWPETEAMRAFATAHGAAVISPATLAKGAFGDVLDRLLADSRGTPVAPTGIAEARALLAPWLSGRAVGGLS